MSKKEQAQDVQVAMQRLRKYLKPGSTVYTTVTHVSSSGMTRHIKLFVVRKGQIENISWEASKIMGWSMAKGEHALKVGGCGMDMCFHTVYTLGRYLFPKGFVPAKAGKSYGRNGSKASEVDNDGGYALQYRTI